MVRVIFNHDTRHRVRRTVLAYQAGKTYNIPRKIAEIVLASGAAREIDTEVPRAEIDPVSDALSPPEIDDVSR